VGLLLGHDLNLKIGRIKYLTAQVQRRKGG
jgi:hypothetical protein